MADQDSLGGFVLCELCKKAEAEGMLELADIETGKAESNGLGANACLPCARGVTNDIRGSTDEEST